MEDRHAQKEQARQNHNDRDIGLGVESFREEIRAVHRQHQKVAMGEVDDAHDAESQRQSDADEAIDSAEQDAGHDRLQDRSIFTPDHAPWR